MESSSTEGRWGGAAQDDWPRDRNTESSPEPASRSGLEDLDAIPGISRISESAVPVELAARTRSSWYRVKAFYQVDDLVHWRSWKRRLDVAGGADRWVFYACPPGMARDILTRKEVAPYDAFFPGVFGRDGLYFFDATSQAARVALKFWVESEAFLLSCRIIPGTLFKTAQVNPEATRPPKGFDGVMALKGSDLGLGPIEGDVYTFYEPGGALIRYATHIVRT